MINRLGKNRARSVKIGNREFITRGIDSSFYSDAFHNSMVVSWPKFFLGFALYFVTMNLLFAAVFWLGGDCIANARPDSFVDKFFFSIETLATVGYGDMHPANFYAHSMVAVEIFLGLSTMAVFTGLIFARFSRPRARVIFADALTLSSHGGRTMLMARLANERHSSVNEARAEMWMTFSEVTSEGQTFRRFAPLPLVHALNPIFAFSWTLFHPVDETSPLHGLGPDELEEMDAFFLVVFNGLDDVSGQTLNVRKAYPRSEVRFGHVFSDILSSNENGVMQLDYGLIHATEPQVAEQEAVEEV
jgi:inward rectifier potassium channel